MALIDLALEEPALNAHGVVRDTYQKWLHDRTTVRCIMRATMNDEFNCKFKNAQLEEMLQVLNESFDTPDNIERYKISCAIFNVEMREGTSVINHVLYMIEQIECLSKLKFFLHEQLEKDVILNSLPKSYLSFFSHYKMTKPVVNYHGLLGLLQTFEKDHQLQKKLMNMVGGSSSGSRPFKKGRRRIKRRCSILGLPVRARS